MGSAKGTSPDLPKELLQRVLAGQEEILDALEELAEATPAIPRRTNPGQPTGPVQSDDAPVDDAEVDRALALIGDLGDSGPKRGLIARWVRRGYSAEQIAAAVDAAIEPYRAKAQDPRAPGENWRANAAYLLAVGKTGGWVQARNHLQGKKDNPIVSADPASNLMRAISPNGPADMGPLVPEILRRADEGIRWDGSRGLAGEDLAKAKAMVNGAAGPWPALWLRFRDPRLVRVLACTNLLELGRNDFMPEQDVTVISTQSLEEWLYEQWHRQRPWAN